MNKIISLVCICTCGTLHADALRTEQFDFESDSQSLGSPGLSLTAQPSERIDGTSLKIDLDSPTNTPVCLYTFPSDILKPGGRYEISAQFHVLNRGNESNSVYLKVECDQGWNTWPDKLILRGDRNSTDAGYRGTQRYEVICSDTSSNNRLVLYGSGSGSMVVDNIVLRELKRLTDGELYDDALLITAPEPDGTPYQPYGMCSHTDWSPDYLIPPDYGTYTDDEVRKTVAMWKDLGIQWVRISMDWERLFPKSPDVPGKAYQKRCELIMDLCDAAGIQYYLQLGATPRWASTNPGVKDFWAYAEKNSRDWDRYIRYVVTHYGNRVTYYEISNETDWIFWHSSDEAYVSRLIRAAKIIRERDPGSKILNAGLATDGVYGGDHPATRNNYLQKLFDLGAGPYIDIFSEHMYTDNVEECIYRINRLYRVMCENGAGDKPIWVTETGYSTFKKRTDAAQVKYITDLYTVLLSHPKVDKVFLYNFRCKGSDQEELEDRFGIVERDFTPRPSYEALKNLPKRKERKINPRFLAVDFPEQRR